MSLSYFLTVYPINSTVGGVDVRPSDVRRKPESTDSLVIKVEFGVFLFGLHSVRDGFP